MEFVFVVQRSDLFPKSYPHGLVLFGEECPEATFHSTVERSGFFVERDYAEQTPTLKQVIPYSVTTREGEVFLTRRKTGGGERRLHGKLSIGIGGHINPVDLHSETTSPASLPRSGRNPIGAATLRETTEELDVDAIGEIRSIGLLNDDSNPVGAVHIGLVQVLNVEGSVSVRETDQLDGRFVSPSELAEMHAEGANFETWSSLLIPHLDSLLPRTTVASTP